MSGRVPELSAVQGRLSIMLAVLYSEDWSRLFLLKCSCSGAVVELLVMELWAVLQHELVPGGREERDYQGPVRIICGGTGLRFIS